MKRDTEYTAEDMGFVKCPNCDHWLSDDGHDGNPIRRHPDGRMGIWYRKFMEGNWSPTPPGCSRCKKFYTLPDLIEVEFAPRAWIGYAMNGSEREAEYAELRTSTGLYYTSRSFLKTQ